MFENTRTAFAALAATTALGCLAPASGATIASFTFDSDPGWITDQPNNFRWDAASGTYIATTYSAPTGAAPSRYAYTPLNLDTSQSFRFQWDQQIQSQSGFFVASHFGLTTSDLAFETNTRVGTPQIIPTSTVNAGAGRIGNLYYHSSNLNLPNGYNGSSGGTSSLPHPGTLPNQWFTYSLGYDASTSQVTRTVADTATGVQLASSSQTISGAFDPEMVNLGIGMHGFGYLSPRNPQTPSDHQVTAYDNIFVTGEYLTAPPPSAVGFSFPLVGIDSVYTNVVAGGSAFDGIDDPFHYPNAAYFAIDFDVNRDSDMDGFIDVANVVAASAGTIVAVGGTGKCTGEPVCVVIDHGNGYYTEYREFSSLATSLTVGMSVPSGYLLGSLLGGNTRPGCGTTCTPDHLHFQVLYDVAGNGPGPGDSNESVTQLQGVTIGGRPLTDFSLGPNGTGQGSVGFIHSSGDLSANLDGVLDYGTTNPLSVGQTSPGQITVNGPIALDVQNALLVGSTMNGEMYAVNGAHITSKSITVGENLGGQGYLLVENGATVDGGSFVGIGTNSAVGAPAGGIGIVELLSGGQIQADMVRIGDLGSLRMNDGSISGNLIMSGGVMLLGSSPGTGSVFGDYTMTGGFLDIEIGGTTGGLFDVLNVSGDANLLGGTIGISFLNGFLPSVGDTFDFLKVSGATNFSGAQFSVTGLPSSIALSFVRSSGGGFSAMAVTNNPAPVPLPPTFALSLVALVVLYGSIKSKRGLRPQLVC